MAQLGQSKSAIAQFMREARKIWFLPRRNAEAADLPKVLKYLPMDKAQDARNFMLSFHIGWEALREPGKLPPDVGR